MKSSRVWHRVWLQVILVCALCLSFGLPGAAKEIVIQMWDGLTGNDRAVMDSYVTDFNKEYAGRIRLERTPIKWVDFYAKIRVAVAGDAAPDIAIMHRTRVPEHVVANVLRPIDHLYKAFGWKDQDWLYGVIDGGKYDGKLYGTPLDIHAHVHLYNAEAITTAGLPGPPMNSKQFVEYSKKLTLPVANGKVRYATAFAVSVNHLANVLWQWGGEYFGGPKLDQVLLNQEPARQALEYIHDLVYEAQVVAPPSKPQDIFKGEVVMRLVNTADINRARNERDAGGLNLQVARGDMLYGDKQAGIFANSHMFTFPVCKTDAEREKAAMTFVDFFNKNSLRWAALGHLPSLKAAVATPEFRQMKEHMLYAQQQFRFLPSQPWNTGGTILDRLMGTVLRNEAPVESALAETQKTLEAYVAQLKTDFKMQ